MIILTGVHFMNQGVCSCCIRQFSIKLVLWERMYYLPKIAAVLGLGNRPSRLSEGVL